MIRIITIAAALAGSLCTAPGDEPVKLTVGQPAPNFTVTGIDGRTFKLSDKLKTGGTNVALMFSRANW